MDTDFKKRSVLIAGHATSVSLESVFWDELKEIAQQRGLSLNALVAEIDGQRRGNLSSALRLHVVNHLRAQLGADCGDNGIKAPSYSPDPEV